MYTIVFPLNGFDWIGLAIMADVASYIGGYHNRQQVPGYTGQKIYRLVLVNAVHFTNQPPV